MMKKNLLSILTFITFSFYVNAQNVNIPDANFKASLLGNSAINTNSDTEIQVSEAIAYTGALSVSNLGISDLTGIEAFSNLTELTATGNDITTLDLSQNIMLTKIDVTVNDNLTSINVSQCTLLQELYVSDNNLNSLDVTQNTALTHLNCFNNTLNSLDITQNTALKSLGCLNININSIDISQNLALEVLAVSNNNITQLDVSQHTALTHFICNNNNLTQLDLSSNVALTNLACQSNNLTSLNMKNININNVVSLVAISNPNLTCIDVDNEADATANIGNTIFIDASTSFSLDCSSLGMDEVELINNIKVITTTEEIEVISSDNVQLENYTLYNISGAKVLEGNNDLISTASFANGIYILKLDFDKGTVTKKIIIK